MIIHQPEITTKDGKLHFQARIETRNQVPNLPQTLWFRMPEGYADWVSLRSDAFAASLLLLAMYIEEPLEVRGFISPRLAFGLQEYQNIFHAWYPHWFPKIEINIRHYHTPSEYVSQNKVVVAFSGGVDSIYTLWSNLTEQQPNLCMQATHALFVHGMDISIHQEDKYQRLFTHYAPILKNQGVELLKVQTNIFPFYEWRINWQFAHGGPLAGAALTLDRLIGKFLINSTYTYNQVFPLGTSPLLDHWLSTDTLEMIHFGAGKHRLEKMAAISQFKPTHHILHVCVSRDPNLGVNNCGKCWKCIRDMAMLEVLGELSRYHTYKTRFSAWKLLLLLFSDPDFHYIVDIFVSSIRKKRPYLAIASLLLLPSAFVIEKIRGMIMVFFPKKIIYNLKRKVFLDRDEIKPIGVQ